MPWTGKYYLVNYDEMRHARKWWVMIWSLNLGGFHLRIGSTVRQLGDVI
jgi:hypothetical protein